MFRRWYRPSVLKNVRLNGGVHQIKESEPLLVFTELVFDQRQPRQKNSSKQQQHIILPAITD
jgi:hypothetical protein